MRGFILETDWKALVQTMDRSLFMILQNLGEHMVQRANLGLTRTQAFVLYYIHQQKVCTVSQLAEKMEVNPSAVTVMLDRLEKHRWVERTRDTSDRRVVHIALTADGEEILKKIVRLREQVFAHCLRQVTVIDPVVFVQALEELAEISTKMEIHQLSSQDSFSTKP